MTTDKPNILFLMSDEHRPDVTGYEGNSVIRTPTLDWLAETGTVFRNAYTPSPICIPGRQAMMAGQLPRTCDCEWFGQDLAPGHMTFARRLAQHAYQTVACGKLHHTGTDQMMGWTTRIGSDMRMTPGYIEDRDETLFQQYNHSPTVHKWSDTKEILRAGVGRGPVVSMDEYTVQGALNYIDSHFLNPFYDRVSETPLMLKVSLLQPHYPYFTSEEKFNYYLNRVEPFLDQTPADHPFLSQRQVVVGEDVTERDMFRVTAAYYGMIETIDDHYRTVLDALEHAGQDLDDWIIIYTSDHGEMLGEHGIWEKQKFYEASARIPLIIRYPKRFEPGIVDENVNLCDLFATLCELTSTPTVEGLDSRSLVPLMQGDSSTWNNETISQFGDMNLMIKQDSLKYQHYDYSPMIAQRFPEREQAAPSEVLFDLATDPNEMVNVIDESQYAENVAHFRKRLAELGHGPNAAPDYQNAGY